MSTIDSPAAEHALRVRPQVLRGPLVTPADSSHRFEKIPTRVFRHAGEASRAVAAEIATLIRGRQAEGRTCVLGLATGSTPVGVYEVYLSYTGIDSHPGLTHYGLYDTVVAKDSEVVSVEE